MKKSHRSLASLSTSMSVYLGSDFGGASEVMLLSLSKEGFVSAHCEHSRGNWQVGGGFGARAWGGL